MTASHWSEWPSLKNLQTIHAVEGVEKRQPMNWENILPNDVTKKGLIFKRTNSSSHNAIKKKKKKT